jgi:hypothetical protein
VPGLSHGRRARAEVVWIWSITDVWFMRATMRIALWQDGHDSGSTSVIFWRSAAQRPLASVGASRGVGTMAGGPSPFRCEPGCCDASCTRARPNDACCCRADRPSAQREASCGPLAAEANVRPINHAVRCKDCPSVRFGLGNTTERAWRSSKFNHRGHATEATVQTIG